MCGIHFSISPSKPAEISPYLKRCLCARGPDHIATHETRLGGHDSDDDENEEDDDDGHYARTSYLTFTSTVLALRGDHVARQPLVDPDSGSVLCWNGEAWRVGSHDVSGNDGEVIAALLRANSSPHHHGTSAAAERQAGILEVLRMIDGPFALVFFDRASGKVYFGRDRLGRRSLLIRRDDPGRRLVLSSVADAPAGPDWGEVEADGIYVLDLGGESAGTTTIQSAITRFGWLEGEEDAVSNMPFCGF